MPENQEFKESKKVSDFPRDLLQRFMCGGGGASGTRFPANPKEETPENVELSLGLSLNGRFGVEPKRLGANNKLFRASSVANFLTFPASGDEPVPAPLTRTCSLPTGTEEEWRRRKELQSQRRSEAKRKRVEKLKNVRGVKGKTGEDSGPNRNGIEIWGLELKHSTSPSPPLPAASLLPPPPQFSSPGSVGSQGSGGSSGVSDFESQLFTGPNKDTEVKSPASAQRGPHIVPQRPLKIIPSLNKVDSITKSASQIPSMSSQVATASHLESSCGQPSSRIPSEARPDKETSKTMSGDMPCVSTKGDGPNGRKVDGFLYRYKKGEVRIVCVCHGSFLTPEEFVKHAGGGDVEHPLRHIIVNPPSFF